MNLKAVEIKAFVPATDFAISKQFYEALGFEIPWSDDELAYVRHGETSFLLQSFNYPEFVKNYQMHLLVENERRRLAWAFADSRLPGDLHTRAWVRRPSSVRRSALSR